MISLVFVTACGPLGGLLPTPGVAANVQAGQTNQQTIGFTQNEAAPSVTLRPRSRVDTIDQSQTTNYQLPTGVWILLFVVLVIGWMVDTPATIIEKIRNRKKQKTVVDTK